MTDLKYIDLIAEASAPLPPSRCWEHHDSPRTPLGKPVKNCTVAILPSAGARKRCAGFAGFSGPPRYSGGSGRLKRN